MNNDYYEDMSRQELDNICNAVSIYFNTHYSDYNPGQNIWHKVKRYNKIRQDFKNIISNFAFFDSYCQHLITGRKTGN